MEDHTTGIGWGYAVEMGGSLVGIGSGLVANFLCYNHEVRFIHIFTIRRARDWLC